MTTPSIKGTVFASVVETIRKAIESGEISPARAERDLRPADHEMLEAPIVASLWYDIRSFARLSEFLRDTLGGGDDAYLVGLGRDSARALLESGVNAQIQFLHKSAKDRGRGAQITPTETRELLSMNNAMVKSIYNFTEWVTQADPRHPARYVTEIRDAADFPEACIWRALGFTGEMAEWRGGSAEIYKWRRMSLDVVQIYMTRDP